MRYELADEEWTAIKQMLPNKPRGVPWVNDKLAANYLAFIHLALLRLWLALMSRRPSKLLSLVVFWI